MIYTEENIIGVEFNVSGFRYKISEYPEKPNYVLVTKVGDEFGSKGDWERSIVKRYLNEANSWIPVTNSEPQYEIY